MNEKLGKLLKPSLNWLLLALPAAPILYWAKAPKLAVFISAALAIIPLAGWLGKATEELAHYTGPGLSGLLNATLGNSAELIIALVALFKGHTEIVKASITGSIIGNILLVLGLSMLVGGLRFKQQKFFISRARLSSSSLLISAIGLLIPTFFAKISSKSEAHNLDLSLDISIILIVVYGLSLLFELHTHKALFNPLENGEEPGETPAQEKSETNTAGEEEHQPWSMRTIVITLLVSGLLVIWMSELLVATVEEAAKALKMNEVFIGAIVVAVIGNAAEHSAAITMAYRNKMELSFTIAVGSSIQIALFVAPFLVIIGRLFGHPIDLVFTPMEILAIIASVFICVQVSGDGKTNWLEGVQLLAVYLILAFAFYFLPH